MSKPEWENWLRTQLFDQVPCNIAIIDRNYQIVDHNRSFAEVFGEGKDRPCFEVYKGRAEKCSQCMAAQTFNDGEVRVNDEIGIDRKGRTAHYVVQISPIYGENGDIPYLIEMSTDVTETKRLQREYQILFERVPCFVAVLNRDLRIVRANERFRETFGETTGQHCYEIYKRRTEKCENCPAEQTFSDGKSHSGAHVGIDRNGKPTHYIVNTTPLSRGGPGHVAHVIEMALDMTEIRKLEEELERAGILREALIANSVDGIIATDSKDKVIIFNHAAESIMKRKAGEFLGRRLPDSLLPAEIRELMTPGEGTCMLPETGLAVGDQEEVPVRFSGVALRQNDRLIGSAMFFQDLRQIKQLEQDKIEAERLAAVGQTVAGLAHGIKNILTGLEGGMYVVNSGLKKGEQARVDAGWGMLERNISRISMLAKSLLSFSKGHTPNVVMIDPNCVALEVVSLYREAAQEANISLACKADESILPAPLDVEGIHTCLANLVSNALDACQMSEKVGCEVVITCTERDDCLIYEVADNGSGMEYDVKQKVFTNFFTTKGAGGTGLGLLLTRKIVQEHGGKITVDSKDGEGSQFRLKFPRDRLPRPRADVPETKPV